MKKVLSSILISLIVFANLFAPISVGVNKGNIEIKKNEVSAGDLGIKMSSTPTVSDSQITIKIDITWSNFVGISGTSEGARVTIKDPDKVEADRVQIIDLTSVKDNDQTGSYVFNGLTPNKRYEIFSEARQIDMATWNASWKTWENTLLPNSWGLWTMTDEEIQKAMSEESLGVITTDDFKTTLQKGQTSVIPGETKTAQNTQFNEILPACSFLGLGVGTFPGCIAQGFYYILFQPTSYLFALSGVLFDYTFSYSVQDSSYRSAFVVQGWGLVRDFCNLFFIFLLLYIAIGTILSLHSVKTKETIINVVIIGLFINFSLFATQVIIDASNITARVFYNSNAIKITENGANSATGLVSKTGDNGVIPLSAALVNKINPQNLIINSGEINFNQTKNASLGTQDSNLGVGTFIIVTIMASAINIVGFTVFITVAFLFLARVIGLWLAMILAPLAFFTYILPEMAGTKMIGWKHWWPETLKLAFLAPVFIFFMYLILKFLEMNLITDPLGKHGLSFFVATIIPFIFIMIFMMKAKKIAVDMSGEFGEIAVKAGSAVGGLALGAATGGAAFAMRGTIGALGSSIANSKTLARMEARGVPMVRGLRTIGTGASKASFDIRNTKAGSAATSSMGVNAGKGKTGGYKQAEENKIAKRTQRLEELKKVATHENEVNKRKTEVNKKLLEDKNSHDIHQIEADLAIQKQNKANAVTGSQEDKDASAEIARLNKKMVGIKLGKRIEGETNEDGTNKYNTDNGKISKLALESIQKEYNDAEGLVSAAKEEINIANNKLADIEKRKNEARIANGGLLTAEQTNNFQAEKTTADSELSVAKNKLKPLEEKSILALNNLAAANKDAINGYGNSIKELTLKGIEIQHHIDKEGNEIAGKYVKAINSNWNKAVNIFSEGDTDRGRDEASDKMLLGMVVKSASGGDHHSSAPAAPIHEGHKEEKKDSGQKGGDAHGHTGGSAH